jgi:hypothetical protein
MFYYKIWSGFYRKNSHIDVARFCENTSDHLGCLFTHTSNTAHTQRHYLLLCYQSNHHGRNHRYVASLLIVFNPFTVFMNPTRPITLFFLLKDLSFFWSVDPHGLSNNFSVIQIIFICIQGCHILIFKWGTLEYIFVYNGVRHWGT